MAYKPVDWLTLNGGLRYTQFWSEDRSTPSTSEMVNPEPSRSEGGFSPFVGVTVEPLKGAQFYVNYSDALRFPSLFESSAAFTVIPNPDLHPERSSNWEIGANFRKDGVFAGTDTGMVKLAYFNWDIQDYIAREFREFDAGWWGMQVYNIDRAKFSGLEFSGRYENGGFSADLAASYYLDVVFCRTASTCEDKSLYGDYATNHVPPKYSVDLTVSQKLLDDTLTVGGRVSHIGPRAIGHGDVTGQGLSEFIALIDWKPYTLVDVFADYKLNENWTANARIENLTDQYYVDPLGLVQQPGPGRTFYAGLTTTLGGSEPLSKASSDVVSDVDWTGPYVGTHVGGGYADLKGTTTALDGTPGGIPATESANLDFEGLLFGVQGGFNYQFDNRVVIGLEADFSRMYLDGLQDALATEGALANGHNLQAQSHYDLEWMSTLRARAGYAFDRLLVYGTGGVAFLEETERRDQYSSTDATGDIPSGTTTSLHSVDKAKENRFGWTIGGGGEYAIDDNWSIKADYTYTHFDAKDFKFRKASAGATGDYTTEDIVGYQPLPPWPCPPVCLPIIDEVEHPGTSSTVNGRKASNKIDLHALRLGINYRF